MKIVSVLRTGPEYGAEHARYLHDQLKRYRHDAVCLSNLEYVPGVDTLPLLDNDPGWWAKMELFNPIGPLGEHDLFYIDIDTRIVGDLRPLMSAVVGTRRIVMLSDFYHPQHAASGVMFIPACAKEQVWSKWRANAAWYMVRSRRVGRVGDQGVISEAAPKARRWDEVMDGAIVSYKKHVIGPKNPHWVRGISTGTGKVPAGARIVCYHGKPRPWECK